MTWKVRQYGDGIHIIYDDEEHYVTSCQDEQRAQLIASAPRMLEALEEIAALETPRWPSLAEVADIYEQSMKIARAAIAAVKQEVNANNENND